MNFPQWFNLCEALLWAVIACLVLVCRTRAAGPARAWLLVLATTFLCFGGTDVAEIWTGSWTRPLPLLVANVLCVAMLVLGAWRLRCVTRK